MNAVTYFAHNAALQGPAPETVAALSKAVVKQTLDTGLTVAGLVLVGVFSLRAKRKQHGK